MAVQGKKTDKSRNSPALRILESAPATQTAVKFNFPFSIMDKMALVISRIEYWIPVLGGLNTSADIIFAALTAASTVVTISNQADPLIIDNMSISRVDLGVAASGQVCYSPYVKDFSSLPGGGLIVAPSPLYGMIQGVGTGTATDGYIKLFYTYIELNADEYWQLVESRRIISS